MKALGGGLRAKFEAMKKKEEEVQSKAKGIRLNLKHGLMSKFAQEKKEEEKRELE